MMESFTIMDDNNFDDHVDDEIHTYLSFDKPSSFFLFAGAGSGKTRSLVNALKYLRRVNAKTAAFERSAGWRNHLY